MPNLPPGVANMLHPQQYMAAGLTPAAFYGLQQPAAAMYGAYGNAGLEDLAAIQRASAAGLHTLVGSGLPQHQPPTTALQSAIKAVCKQIEAFQAITAFQNTISL